MSSSGGFENEFRELKSKPDDVLNCLEKFDDEGPSSWEISDECSNSSKEEFGYRTFEYEHKNQQYTRLCEESKSSGEHFEESKSSQESDDYGDDLYELFLEARSVPLISEESSEESDNYSDDLCESFLESIKKSFSPDELSAAKGRAPVHVSLVKNSEEDPVPKHNPCDSGDLMISQANDGLSKRLDDPLNASLVEVSKHKLSELGDKEVEEIQWPFCKAPMSSKKKYEKHIFGDECKLAHGNKELRPSPVSYKSPHVTPCKYYSSGTCSFGSNCRFLHHETSTTSSPTVTTAAIKQEEPTSSSIVKLKSINWAPADDGIDIQTAEDFDACMNNVLYGPRKNKRLPIFSQICPE